MNGRGPPPNVCNFDLSREDFLWDIRRAQAQWTPRPRTNLRDEIGFRLHQNGLARSFSFLHRHGDCNSIVTAQTTAPCMLLQNRFEIARAVDECSGWRPGNKGKVLVRTFHTWMDPLPPLKNIRWPGWTVAISKWLIWNWWPTSEIPQILLWQLI